MHRTQARPIPERLYEPNIIHNPFTWFGIWTPHGWRVHRKRWGRAQHVAVKLNGDGKTTFFPHALLDPQTGRVEWQDDLHCKEDRFTDAGIYPSDPRVEYPAGQPRWAVSHTLLNHLVADHNLYTHEYVWDMTHGHLQTHFHHHVQLEEARTDARDGRTVLVKHRPISTTIEGNVHYPLPNSAVRGVWAKPDKSGRNLYARRQVQLITMHNSIYAIAPQTPVVQCHGMWETLPSDPLEEVFDCDTGLSRDDQRLIDQCHVPLDEPKLGSIAPQYKQVPSRCYEGPALLMEHHETTVSTAHLEELRLRRGTRYHSGKVGYGAFGEVGVNTTHFQGYGPQFDLNENGEIDEEDEQRLARHVGRVVRYNAYLFAYFGGDWLTTGVNLHPEHEPGIKAIADYTHGAGYDSVTGVIRLFETPGPDQPVWVEYHYDAPAEPGEGNIVVHLFRELE